MFADDVTRDVPCLVGGDCHVVSEVKNCATRKKRSSWGLVLDIKLMAVYPDIKLHDDQGNYLKDIGNYQKLYS